ncbi:hypothetical protein FACS1894204_03970 [Synergistales bacterium]|nr:hypothetical protein FACS1894204_03970 [Synergistales bacterium]
MAGGHEISFVIGAALGSSFNGVFSKAGNTMGMLQKRMSDLSQNQAAITSLGKLQAAVNTNGTAYNTTAARAAALAEQMRDTANPSKELTRQFSDAQTKAEGLRKKLLEQRNEMRQLRTSLSAAGIDTKNFSNEQARLAQNTKLAANAAKLQQAQERLQKAQGAFDKSQQTLSWGNIKNEIMGAAVPALALAGPIKQAADFEQAMARVGAVTGVTGEKFDKLSAQSRQLGRDTQFTAMQAANSQEMLARAGFKTEEIIQAMPGLLNMAAAEGMDLANAADIAASSLRGYQLAADQTNRVADVLAKTSAASNSSIAGIGDSMKYVAPIAAGLKIPFEESAAMIGVMADAGIKGSQAGTALRAALLRLSKEPKQTEEALAKLGIATRDAQGNLRTMPSLMQALSEKMKGMGEADKMGELAKIFGGEAASGMLAIMDAAKSGKLKELTSELYNAEGAAGAMAERMNNTAQGAMKRLSSATESLMIDVGNVLLPAFSSSVEMLTSVTSKASEFAQRFPAVTNVLVGAVAGFAALKVGMSAAKIVWTTLKLPIQAIRLGLAKANVWMTLFRQSAVLAAAKTKLLTYAMKAQALVQSVLNKVVKLGNSLLDVGKLAIVRAKQIAITAATKAWVLAQGAWNAVMKFGRGLLNIGHLVIYHAKQIAISVATKALTAAQWLWNAAMTANPIGAIIVAIAGLVAAGYYLYNNWDTVCANVTAAWGWIWDKIEDFLNWVNSVFSWDWLTSGWDAAQNAISSGWETIKSWFTWDNLLGNLSGAADVVMNMITGPFLSAYDTIKSWFGGLFGWIFGESVATATGVASQNQTSLTAAQARGDPLAATNSYHHATGGIFNTPHLGLVAEAGAEAIIPLTNPSRGIPLWKAAGEEMGVKFGVGNTTTNNIKGGSPVINITVNGGDENIARRVADEVRRALIEMQEYSDRVSFA